MFCKSKIDYEYENKCLKDDLFYKKEEVKTLQKLIDNLKEQIDDYNSQECECEFDFYNPSIEVFSIERLKKVDGYNTNWVTNIGYFIIDKSEDDKVHEWTIYTSVDRHNELVEEFRKSKENRK